MLIYKFVKDKPQTAVRNLNERIQKGWRQFGI